MALIYKSWHLKEIKETLDVLYSTLNEYKNKLNKKVNCNSPDVSQIYSQTQGALCAYISEITNEILKLKQMLIPFTADIEKYDPGIDLPVYAKMSASTYSGDFKANSIFSNYSGLSGAVYNYSGGNYNSGSTYSGTAANGTTILSGSKYFGKGYMTDEDWEEVSSVINKNEFKCQCGRNCEGKDANIIKKQLILDLVKVSEHFGGKQIHVTSGYRCKEHNDAQPNSSPTSFHMSGSAVDFWIEGVSTQEIMDFVKTLDSYNHTYTDSGYMNGIVHYDIGNYQPPTPEITVVDGITYVDGILVANKTYALPASYNPGVNKDAQDALEKMQASAAGVGIEIPMISGFRSYSEQDSIYTNYVNNDGQADADTYSARPGHSEHQTGLAFDLVDPNTANISKNKEEFDWLAEHAHEYGFIIRYPEGKEHITGYQYEPWHVRYVGVDAATAIKESGLCFEEYFDLGVSTYK